jgi:hypothetical protein
MWTSGTDIINSINNSWQLALLPTLTEEELVQELAKHINEMIVHDFPRLIHMLYMIDVNEGKLKEMLRSNKGTDAALMIAHLVVERQKQKQRSRELFSPRDQDIDDDLRL